VRITTMVSATLLAAVAIAASGCDGSPPKSFAYVYGTGVGPNPLRAGWEYGYLYGDMNNVSHSVLTIDAVSLRGPGIGRVVDLSHVQIAPLIAGVQATPGGLYQTQPPVTMLASCHKQVLRPVRGYRMRPGAQARLWIVVRALRPGRWNIPRQVVTYTMNGSTYQHVFPLRYWGTVSLHARVYRVTATNPDEVQCVKPTGAVYLAHYHG
jgi:hypothetical protein